MSGETDRSKRPGAEPKVLPKRFYRDVSTSPAGAEYRILLDGRAARTPGKRPLAVASQVLARRLADEWSVQNSHIDPATMPLTTLACTAIDAVTGNEPAVRAEIAKYAGSDLLCYRAERPEGLVALQSKHWDPPLAWARDALGLRLALAAGLMPVTQPADSAGKVVAALAPLPALPLAAVHVLTTGSAVLALAVARNRLTLDAAWAAAHVDEDWQIARWGDDAEAAERRRLRRAEADAAMAVLECLG
jgi:chaperone required for assembly of F1-ATPase